MANHSDLTRKEQVFAYLKVRLNAWVDGTDLATAEVGGSEGLKRLRELRQDLADNGNAYEIQMRGHPDPDKDIFQYRLIEAPRSVYASPAPAVPVASAEPVPIRERPRESQQPPARRSDTHLAFDPALGYVAVYDGPIPVADDVPIEPVAKGQLDMGVEESQTHIFTKKPDRLELGKTLPCPMCHGVHRAIKEKDPLTGKSRRDSKIIGYEELTRNPQKASQVCPRCNGFGVIPNG